MSEKAKIENKELIGKMEISDSININVCINTVRGEDFVDLRKFIDTPKYAGPTKNGVSIPLKMWPEFMKLLKKVKL